MEEIKESKNSSKLLETFNYETQNFSKTYNKNSAINLNNLNILSQEASYKIKLPHRESINTNNSNSNEVSLNLSNFIISSNKRYEKYGSTMHSTNQPSTLTSHKNTDENTSTISYSNNHLYKTVNNNSGQTFKFDLQENNIKNEELKLKEIIKNKDKKIDSLQNELDNISKKAEEVKKTFHSKLQKYNCIRQSNEQLKKMICMMIANKK